MTRKSVAVLGCGPAGLLAAYRLASEGFHPFIYSDRKAPSFIAGAQFLHVPIEGLTRPEPDAVITFAKAGTREGYATKVYGSPDAPCSWDEFPTGEAPAWSLREINAKLWGRFSNHVSVARIKPEDVAFLVRTFRMVVSTIPAQSLCYRPRHHEFTGAKVWIRHQAPEGLENVIAYNGLPTVPWYRASNIDGEGFTEYGHAVQNAASGTKPLSNTCDCFPEVVRAGRFGRWEKGVLVHDVLDTVESALRGRGLALA
jgi:hypothetical protein